MSDTLCPVCRWWYDGDEGHKCAGTEREQHQRALADRDRRIEALTKVLAKLEFGVKTGGVGFCPWCGSDEPGPHEPDCELRKALASAAGAEGETT